MAINKVEFGGRTLIDLTDTTATADKILTGYGAYGKDGVWVDGTAIESSPDGAVYQDSEGYVVLDDGPGTHVEVESLSVTENGTYTAPTGYAYSPVSVDVEPSLQSKSATPTESAQTITADSGYDGLSQVSVGAISSTYVGSGISRKTSDDLTASGATVTAPAGYYSAAASKSVASGSAGTPTATKGTVSNHSVSVTPSVTNTTGYITGGTKTGTAVTVSASELVSGTYNVTSSGTKDVTNYASVSVPSGSATASAAKGTVSNNSVTVTPSVTTTAGYMAADTLSGTAVTVSASELVSGTYTVSSSGTKDVTNYASASVPAGTAGTPTVSKGTVSNHSITVTPSVTNSTGWITGGTKTGTAATVSASELVSGTYSVTSSGTKDVTNYASISVSAGSVNSPTATKGTVSNNSITVTPSVDFSEGYISGGTNNGAAVTVSASELVSGNLSVTENGTGIDVTNYETVSVDVEQGDMLPHFYMHYASDYSTINSTTCDMTYSEIITLMGEDGNCSALVYEGFPDEVNPDEESYSAPKGATCRYDSINNNIIIYTIDSFGGPFYTTTYTSDGVLSTVINNHKYSSDLIVNGATVTAPSGYYPFNASKSVASAAQATPTMAFVSATGLVTATATQTSGYVSAGTKSSTYQLPVKAAATYTPTETAQTIGSYQWLTGAQTIAAISSTYVGTGIAQRSAADIFQSGTYISAASGYYSLPTILNLPTTEHLNPTLNFNSVTGSIQALHDAYDAIMEGKMMTGGAYTSSSMALPILSATTYTPTETAQTISRYQWLTGAQTIAAISSTYVGTGVTQRSAADMTVSGSYVTAPSGYYSQAFSKAVSLGTFDTINTTYYSNTGTVELKATVSAAGWFSSTASKVKSLSPGTFLPNKGSATYTPGVSDQIISSKQWLKGSQTILGDVNLVSSNIKSGVSIFGVVGTMEEADPFTTVYRSFAYHQLVYSSHSNVLEWTDSLTSVSGSQFYCGRLYGEFTFNNTTVIGSSAFYSCYYLGGITAPKASQVGAWAFYSCTSLTYADFQSATVISSSAFYGCTRLSNISFPKAVTIYSYAFATAFKSASEFVSVYFPKVTTMHPSAFAGCFSGLTYANFPLLKTVAVSAFVNCSSLYSIELPVATTISSWAFNGCVALVSIDLPSVTLIGVGAFSGCTSMFSANLPSLQTTHSGAFYYCTNLSDFNAPNLLNLGSRVFLSCSKLTSISLPLANNISDYTFAYCLALKDVYIPNASTIGSNAFNSCSSLEIASYSLATAIYYGAFVNCLALSEVHFSIASIISGSCFANCPSLTIVDIPNCTTIGSNAFLSCTALSVVSFPNLSVIQSTYAFRSCYNLLSVYLLGSSIPVLSSPLAFSSTPIYGYTTSTGGVYGSIYVPASLYDSYRTATNWATFSSRFVSLTDAEIEALNT